MKFTTSALAAYFLLAASSTAFQPLSYRPVASQQLQQRNTFSISSSSSSSLCMSTVEEEAQAAPTTKKEARLRMMKSDQFYRQGFKDVRVNVEEVMENQFKSSIVDTLKTSNYVMEREGVKVYLAKVSWWNGRRAKDLDLDLQIDPSSLCPSNDVLNLYLVFSLCRASITINPQQT